MLSVKEAAEKLRAMDRILILTHVRPDGDTVGCAAGLCAALRQLGKTAFLLPNPELTDNTLPYFRPYEAPEDYVPDAVVSVDIASAGLFPENARPFLSRVELAVDHHPSFEGFGRDNLARPSAAACGEIVYDLAAALGPITAEIALPLYVAVSTDTGCFQYANTTPRTHQVAAALMTTGIDYRAVNKTFFRTKSRKRLALEADMLSKMEFYDRGRTVVLTVPISLMERVGASESDAEDLSALGAQIEGTDCAVTARELGHNVWKLSLRTGSRVNATRVCALLGGGGHAAAAGATVEASLEETRRRVLDAIARVVPDFVPEPVSGTEA
ncbi:MAG: DHH family phosphoesterase [Oscillibacter sp.]|jgi:phosphoesterase RecJ-like protein|nr:DHH family phosphoesterase [Oscillibacter sp.]